MKIEIDLNDMYCENGQWKVALNSSHDGLTKQEVLDKIIKDFQESKKRTDELELWHKHCKCSDYIDENMKLREKNEELRARDLLTRIQLNQIRSWLANSLPDKEWKEKILELYDEIEALPKQEDVCECMKEGCHIAVDKTNELYCKKHTTAR